MNFITPFFSSLLLFTQINLIDSVVYMLRLFNQVFQKAQAPGQLTSYMYGGRMIFLTWFDHPRGKLFFYRSEVQNVVPTYENQLFSC